MTQKEILNNTNVIDLTTQVYGKMDYLFELLEQNPTLETVESEVASGFFVVYDDKAVFLESQQIEETKGTENKRAVFMQGQTLFDMALQMYGGVEGIFDLLELNPALDGIDNAELTGELIEYTEQNLSLTEYFRKNKIFITTGSSGALDGIGARSFDDSFDLSFL